MRLISHSVEWLLDRLVFASRIGLCKVTSRCLEGRCYNGDLVEELFRRASLNQLIEEAKKVPFTDEMRAAQRESWARQDMD